MTSPTTPGWRRCWGPSSWAWGSAWWSTPGGACCGDDALALTISHLTGWDVGRSYLITDITVLALSLTYIPAAHLAWSLLSVTLSSGIISLIQRPRGAKT